MAGTYIHASQQSAHCTVSWRVLVVPQIPGLRWFEVEQTGPPIDTVQSNTSVVLHAQLQL